MNADTGDGGDPAGRPEFWIERWNEGHTAFHKTAVQPWLVDHLQRLAPRGDERVLVPLCGKSVDMAWLEARGRSVVGVDVAEKGLREFLGEQARVFTERAAPPFQVFATGRIELWRGDFFALDPARHGTFPAILDRAALIAMPAQRRPDYARKLIELLAPGGRILLVVLEFDERKMAGPPFSVGTRDVERLFGAACAIETLGAKPVLDEEPRFRERGLDALTERALLLTSSARATS